MALGKYQRIAKQNVLYSFLADLRLMEDPFMLVPFYKGTSVNLSAGSNVDTHFVRVSEASSAYTLNPS